MADTFGSLIRALPTATIPTVATALALWKADSLLSNEGAKLIYGYISQTLEDPTHSRIEHEFLKLLRGYLSFDRGAIPCQGGLISQPPDTPCFSPTPNPQNASPHQFPKINQPINC